MQKIELTNKQYRLLLQLVSLGIDVIDNAALGDDEEDDDEVNDESPLLNDAVDLEGFLMAHFKKFGVKDIVMPDAEEEELNYSEQFSEDQQMISNSAYFNKTAEIASFQLGMRDYKEANGADALENVDPQEGVDKIMTYSLKYLNEIFENGFVNFHLNTDRPAKIISLSAD
ncbi:hypothetical protein [Agriterribacter sp.]|uniref:hypothetical protein n=1 Tax=Agriterribacter sp. TaxID=2821509 RepID=UPI002CBA62B5|nr:hypothetical protein [Agriterribacter sp.]HRP56211.1 hypothetical protein [Agriterribacter sp.]